MGSSGGRSNGSPYYRVNYRVKERECICLYPSTSCKVCFRMYWCRSAADMALSNDIALSARWEECWSYPTCQNYLRSIEETYWVPTMGHFSDREISNSCRCFLPRWSKNLGQLSYSRVECGRCPVVKKKQKIILGWSWYKSTYDVTTPPEIHAE
jgi:hypothetical protein